MISKMHQQAGEGGSYGEQPTMEGAASHTVLSNRRSTPATCDSPTCDSPTWVSATWDRGSGDVRPKRLIGGRAAGWRVGALMLLWLVSAGCQPSGRDTGKGGEGAGGSGSGASRMTVAMIPKLVGIGYFEATRQGAEEAAAELNVDLLYDGPTEASSEGQVRLIDTWLARGVDVLAVAPNDPQAIAQTLRAAQEGDTPVVTWDTDADAERSGRRYFVNQAPNAAIGETLVDVMAAGVLARGQDLAGDYLIVSGTATAANQNVWMEFMRQRMAEKYPQMRLLQHLTPGEDAQKALEQTSEAINAQANLKGIWGITSVSLPAAAKAVRDAQRGSAIYVTGLSLPGEMRQYVEDGTVEKFVLWDAVDLGYLTVHVAHRLKQGNLPSGRSDFGRLKQIEVRDQEVILGPPLIFTRENIGKYNF